MNGTLIRKAIREGLPVFLACAAGLVSFCIFRVWIVGRLDSARFKQIVDLLPREWDRYSSVDFGWMISYLGRVVMTFDEPMVVMLIAMWGIVRGSDVVSGELNRGTMEMVLAQPVKRSSVYCSHVFVSLIGTGLLALAVWLGMSIGVEFTTIRETVYRELPLPNGTKIPLTFLKPREELVAMRDVIHSSMFWPGIVNSACMGWFFVGLTSWLSALDRYRWRTLGIVTGIYFVMAMLKIGGMAVDSLRWLLHFSIFSLYEPELHIRLLESQPEKLWEFIRWNEKLKIQELGPLGCNLVLIGMTVGLLLHGNRIFRRRDLTAPI